MKRTLAWILTLVMLLGMLPMSVFAEETATNTTFKLYFETDVTDVSALEIGDKITVTAYLENNPGFAGMKTKLTWDNSVVQFEGFTTETFRNQEYLVSEVIGDATYSQTAGTVVVGEVENLTANGKLWEAVFTVLKGGETGIALNTDGQEFQMTNANLEKLTPVIDQTALAGLTVKHTCVYVETVVAPTCTEGGYTLHKCACGDEYRTGNTPAAGHKYENNVCTVCGASGTVIPEGAKFTGMLTDKGEIVTVTEKDGYYLVEVPYGTTSLMVTYPEDLPKVDEFGYVTTRMVGFDGVYQDGYGITRKDGKIIVGLALEKAPANGAPTVLRLINLDNEYGKKITVCMADGSTETFALTYKLGNGQHFAVLPLPENCVGYSITGEAIASDGYSFNVSILEGYEASENFAVKVNGQTVSTEPGRISIPSVTEDMEITVTGVSKIVEVTDISVTVDLRDYAGTIDGYLGYMGYDYNYVEVALEAGKANTLSVKATDCWMYEFGIYEISPLVIGYEINGTTYAIPDEYTGYDLGGGFNMNMDKGGYIAGGNESQNPGTLVIKPIMATSESLGAAPAFAEDCVKVNDISVVGADVVSAEWNGDVLNVILAEDTALDATFKTMWNVYAKNTNDPAVQNCVMFNGKQEGVFVAETGGEGTFDISTSVTLANGVAAGEYKFEPNPNAPTLQYVLFTPKTFTVNFYVGEMPHIHDYESVVTPPTCTEGGYTTYTCKAGDDTYVSERVPALGHTNVNGTCSVCGAALTVIPEGATFLDMMTSDGKAVTVTDLGTDPFFGMGKLYKVEVPVGTIQVNITLDQSKVYVDQFGYAKTMMQGFDNVTEDAYGQTTKDGKVTVGLQMEKTPANGSSSTIRLLNVPYPEDVYEVKAVGLVNAAYDGLDFYAFTYMMAEGQYYAKLPDSFMYTVTGDGVASNGYKFNVSINNGYEATEDFAVRVNGEIVATKPGEVTVASVTEDLTITVEGVNKIYNPETDVSITVDLTEYTGEIKGQLWLSKKSGPSYTADLVPGKNNTIIVEASDLWQMFATINSIGSDVTGYDINGEIRDPGYLSFGFNVRDNAQPGKYVIKPVVVVDPEAELKAAKTEAKTAIESYKDAADYRDAQKEELAAVIEVAKAEIDAAADANAVAAAVTAAKAEIDKIKTDEQLTKEEEAAAAALAQAKATAKAEIAGYKNAADYREAQQAKLAAAIEAANAAIDVAETTEAVAAIVTATKTAMDAIKTDAELDAEEDKAAADEVTDEIAELPAIGSITLKNAAAVKAAYAAYEALTEAQKALVPEGTVQALEAAVEKIEELEEEAKQEDDDKPVVIVPAKPVISKPVAPKMTFSDVSKSDWFYDSVKEAYENGLIDGMTADTFDPNGKLTIAQAIKLAAALHQLEKNGKVTLKNGSDVWYTTYVDYAIANDIIGKSYGELTDAQMNAAATRSEFVSIFHGAKDFYAEKNTVADNAIPDVKMTDKNADEIYEFYRAGILTGNDAAGTFAPNSNIKRSEVATILIRMFDLSARQSIILK